MSRVREREARQGLVRRFPVVIIPFGGRLWVRRQGPNTNALAIIGQTALKLDPPFQRSKEAACRLLHSTFTPYAKPSQEAPTAQEISLTAFSGYFVLLTLELDIDC